MADRRFPPPWSVENTGTGSAFVVIDARGQKLAYVYYEEEPGSAGKLLTKGRGAAHRVVMTMQYSRTRR